MTQIDLLAESDVARDGGALLALGRGYALRLPRGPRAPGDLYHRGSLSKRVNLRDKAERRLLAVELMQHGVNQTRLAEALQLSRQTLHNYRESYREFGVHGLLHGYSPGRSKSEERQRHLHVHQRRPGTKARELEALRRTKREQAAAPEQVALTWEGEPAIATTLGAALATAPEVAAPSPVSVLPYAQAHGWEASRYAGVFPLLLVLVSQWQWLARLMGMFGDGWRLFMAFALMAGRNLRSLEQLKHVRAQEAGRVLGLGCLPSVDTLWGWFHEVAKRPLAGPLLAAFFRAQIQHGQVGGQWWYTDGHLLPYTGGHKVHDAYHTQRRMPTPGQTNLVTCDERGRIVCFAIEEGKGDLRARILALGAYARAQALGLPPVQIFDREGTGLAFFAALVAQQTPFITWEKDADTAHLRALAEHDFTASVHVNGTDYRLLEETRACVHVPEGGDKDAAQRFDLRRVVVWNLRTHHRAVGASVKVAQNSRRKTGPIGGRGYG